MCYCGSQIPKTFNGDSLLSEIRKVDNLNITLKLGNYDALLRSNGTWKTNVRGKPENKEDAHLQINELKENIKEKDQEIEVLEKKYLAKVARLFIMAQVHCEVKLKINDLMKTLKPTVIALEDYHRSFNN